jgi:GTP:adenosylcobinamide-phosphate guanylyltransferase
MKPISPERQRIAKILKNHIEKAIEELGKGYTVDLQGEFDRTPITILIEVNSKDEMP